ncbi:MAG: cytochrome c3 family protein [Pseudomonadota bacterium]|jgi:predicted CXXCH cytochrome family protein|nr:MULTISPECIES: cytochrome c3 family protein [unclassified Sphingomonas]
MMRRWGLILIALNLCALIVLAFTRPHLMVAPGALTPAHSAITRDCFACHVPFKGVSADRCTACHKVADIGIRSTKGVPLEAGKRRIAFHQSLAQPNCLACHSDHSGPQLVKASQTSFAHELLRPDVRGLCASCHRAPPTALHAQAGSNCAQCHTQKGWKPASFDHAHFFALSGPHNTSCATCHVGGNFSRYTCYSCHEHQPDQIRAKHAEEGIRNIDNCARCHRSGSGEGGERERGGRDDD